MKIILYESSSKNLYPITLTRPAFDILCAGTNLYKICKLVFHASNIDFLVPHLIQKITTSKYPLTKRFDDDILFLDSSLVPSFSEALLLLKQIKKQKNVILKNRRQIIGAYLSLQSLNLSLKKITNLTIKEILAGLKIKNVKTAWPTFNFLHEIITYNKTLFNANLKFLISSLKEIQSNIFVGKNVNIHPTVVFDVTLGPIIIRDYSEIMPFSYLVGPLYLGDHCVIKESTSLKNSCLGDVCRLGGEIDSTIIQGYSNKQHYGFIGHSYLGEWINLGAGTTNSNLKNTYGKIKMQNVETKEQLLGCVIGDYTKTAINTAIFTGKVIGVNSLLYGQITNDVPSFTNAGSALMRPATVPLEVATKIQKAMFIRRDFKQTKTHISLLKNVYNLTAQDRQKNQITTNKITFAFYAR
ncbi:hypothetical protein COT27_02170 [Candidatus Kuenenbacteria bacterium CG08_land_8_20_14_0_20_37_23]|uniref:Glucose-1-phosphate thymidylyltransferase n=1 Tax=Candidatus Kuenenbacteria bacterium CG08_land_8_20_14_0_20_37_23 TaxID=1974617 RepID=A0A2M6XSJ4_9BACT|nr:MAG: hypothetical protein COT27_02170 [Candidatus Kuenenbacteria bacterium CG08_land_8_20_14_0_20_37_23]